MSTLPQAKKLDFDQCIEFSDFIQHSKDLVRKPDEVLKSSLNKKAETYLLRAQNLVPHRCFEYQEEDVNGDVLFHVEKIKVPTYTEKLFEGTYIDEIAQPVADYIFASLIGYDDYFDCPCIILKDRRNEVVDIVKYRPSKDGYENLPKYLQEKAINKPEGRGIDFLFPFQVEMERLIKKEGYFLLVRD